MIGTMIDLTVAQLLSSRLCHEIISPVGAIANGVELLGEDDPDFVKDAIALVEQSSKKAGQRLQFYRFAYGYAASGPASDPGELARGLLEGGKIRLDWSPDLKAMEPAWQRLAINLVVMAAEAIPRGGLVAVRPSGKGLEITAEGDMAACASDQKAALDRTVGIADLTSRTVHAYYTGLLAQQLSSPVAVAHSLSGKVSFVASPP